MSGYAGGYAINPFPTGPGVGTEATDKAVLYWDGVNNLIKGSSDLVFDATLKTLTLGAGGQFLAPNGAAATPAYSFSGDPDTGFYSTGTQGVVGFTTNGNLRAAFNGANFALGSTGSIYWTATNAAAAADLAIYRDAANTLAQRNSTNAQTLRIYNTYTDASNYERGKVAWESNVFVIGTEKAGTGSNRSLSLEPVSGINYSKGHFYPKSDASWYLGLGALKWLATFTGGFTGGTITKSANYTVDVGDHVILVSAAAANRTITLPAAADNTGRIIHIKKTDSSANYVRIDGNGSELVEDAQTQDLIRQGENLQLQCDGSQWWIL